MPKTINVQEILHALIGHRGPGLYELTCDVPNPKPDGRCPKEKWLRATWAKGERFVVDRRVETADQYERTGLILRGPGESYGYPITGERDPKEEPQAARIAALAPHLRRVMPEDVFDLQSIHATNDRETAWVLEYLVRTGVVQLATVAAAMDEQRRSGDHWRNAFPEDYKSDEPTAHSEVAAAAKAG